MVKADTAILADLDDIESPTVTVDNVDRDSSAAHAAYNIVRADLGLPTAPAL